jgi:hypothetical protein
MRCAALCAAPLLCIAPLWPAQAEDRSAHAADLRTVLFGSMDGGNSAFAAIGIKRTLRGALDESGPIGMASVGYGRTVERAWWYPEDVDITRHLVQGTRLLDINGFATELSSRRLQVRRSTANG